MLRDSFKNMHRVVKHSVLTSSELTVYIGPPQQLQYPRTIESESEEWARWVASQEFRTVEYEKEQYYDAMEEQCASPGTISKWIQQEMLDGTLARRVIAYKDHLPEFMYEVRDTYYSSLVKKKTITSKGIAPLLHVPFASLSPYYGSNTKHNNWCLFGEPCQLVPHDVTRKEWQSKQHDNYEESVLNSYRTLRKRHAKHNYNSSNITKAYSYNRTNNINSNQEEDEPAEHLEQASWLAITSALYSTYDAVWVRGAVLTNSDTGDFIFILGPPQSGKTTLALHALTAAFQSNSNVNPNTNNDNNNNNNNSNTIRSKLRLTASERFLLADGVRPLLALSSSPQLHEHITRIELQYGKCNDNSKGWQTKYNMNDNNNSNTNGCVDHDNIHEEMTSLLMTVGIPGSINVGLGSILGTLKPNIPLASYVPLSILTTQPTTNTNSCNTPPTITSTETIAASLLQNSETVLWNMNKRHRIHVNEMYNNECNQSQSWAPVVLGHLKGIIYLDWSVAWQSSVPSAVHEIPLVYKGVEFLHKVYANDDVNAPESLLPWNRFLPPIHSKDGNNSDEISSWDVFAYLLTRNGQNSKEAPVQMYCMTGAVDYDRAINLIFEMLSM